MTMTKKKPPIRQARTSRRREGSARPATTPAKPPSPYAIARTRREQARARREELALKKELLEVHDVKQCAHQAFASGRRVRDAMLNIPSRLCGVLAAESSQHTVFVTLQREITDALSGLGGPSAHV